MKSKKKPKQEEEVYNPEAEKRKVVAEVNKKWLKVQQMASNTTIPMVERIAQMKQEIHRQKQRNKELATKQNRIKFDSEKAIILTEKAKHFQDPPQPRKVNQEESIFSGIDTGPVHMRQPVSKEEEDKFKHRKELCSCGSRDPEFRGYCIDCVEKLKLKYEKLQEKNELMQKEKAELTKKYDINLEEKMSILKHKMAQYGATVETDMFDVF